MIMVQIKWYQNFIIEIKLKTHQFINWEESQLFIKMHMMQRMRL